MKLIIGLGNPEEKYAKTRHNLGFMMVDELLRKMTPVEKTAWQKNAKFNSLTAKVGDLLLVKPQTFMNASGLAVAKLANFYKVRPEDIWVVHDDVDLVLGRIKIRRGGGSAGHRGVQSVIDNLGADQFVRFRLGIGHPGAGSSNQEMENYVLSAFTGKQSHEAKKMIKKTIKAIQASLKDGL